MSRWETYDQMLKSGGSTVKADGIYGHRQDDDLDFLGEIAPAAFRTDNLLLNAGMMLRHLEGSSPVDMSFDRHSEENLRGTVFLERPDLRRSIAGANSRYEILRADRRVRQELEDREVLERAGGKGFVASMMAGIASPEVLLPIGIGVRAGRSGYKLLKTAAAAGGINAAQEATIEGVLHGAQETRTGLESGFAIGAGFVLGSVLGGAAQAMTNRAFNGAARETKLLLDYNGVEHLVDEATGNITLRIGPGDDFDPGGRGPDPDPEPIEPEVLGEDLASRAREKLHNARQSMNDAWDGWQAGRRAAEEAEDGEVIDVEVLESTWVREANPLLLLDDGLGAAAGRGADDAGGPGGPRAGDDATGRGPEAAEEPGRAERVREAMLSFEEAMTRAADKIGEQIARSLGRFDQRFEGADEINPEEPGGSRFSREGRFDRGKRRATGDGDQPVGAGLPPAARALREKTDRAFEEFNRQKDRFVQIATTLESRGRGRQDDLIRHAQFIVDEHQAQFGKQPSFENLTNLNKKLNDYYDELESMMDDPDIPTVDFERPAPTNLDEVIEAMEAESGRDAPDEIDLTSVGIGSFISRLKGLGKATQEAMAANEIHTLADLRRAIVNETLGPENVPRGTFPKLRKMAFTRAENEALENEWIDLTKESPERVSVLLQVARRRPEAMRKLIQPRSEVEAGVAIRAVDEPEVDRIIDQVTAQQEAELHRAGDRRDAAKAEADTATEGYDRALETDGEEAAELEMVKADEKLDYYEGRTTHARTRRDLFRVEKAQRKTRRWIRAAARKDGGYLSDIPMWKRERQELEGRRTGSLDDEGFTEYHDDVRDVGKHPETVRPQLGDRAEELDAKAEAHRIETILRSRRVRGSETERQLDVIDEALESGRAEGTRFAGLMEQERARLQPEAERIQAARARPPMEGSAATRARVNQWNDASDAEFDDLFTDPVVVEVEPVTRPLSKEARQRRGTVESDQTKALREQLKAFGRRRKKGVRVPDVEAQRAREAELREQLERSIEQDAQASGEHTVRGQHVLPAMGLRVAVKRGRFTPAKYNKQGQGSIIGQEDGGFVVALDAPFHSHALQNIEKKLGEYAATVKEQKGKNVAAVENANLRIDELLKQRKIELRRLAGITEKTNELDKRGELKRTKEARPSGAVNSRLRVVSREELIVGTDSGGDPVFDPSVKRLNAQRMGGLDPETGLPRAETPEWVAGAGGADKGSKTQNLVMGLSDEWLPEASVSAGRRRIHRDHLVRRWEDLEEMLLDSGDPVRRSELHTLIERTKRRIEQFDHEAETATTDPKVGGETRGRELGWLMRRRGDLKARYQHAFHAAENALRASYALRQRGFTGDAQGQMRIYNEAKAKYLKIGSDLRGIDDQIALEFQDPLGYRIVTSQHPVTGEVTEHVVDAAREAEFFPEPAMPVGAMGNRGRLTPIDPAIPKSPEFEGVRRIPMGESGELSTRLHRPGDFRHLGPADLESHAGPGQAGVIPVRSRADTVAELQQLGDALLSTREGIGSDLAGEFQFTADEKLALDFKDPAKAVRMIAERIQRTTDEIAETGGPFDIIQRRRALYFKLLERSMELEENPRGLFAGAGERFDVAEDAVAGRDPFSGEVDVTRHARRLDEDLDDFEMRQNVGDEDAEFDGSDSPTERLDDVRDEYDLDEDEAINRFGTRGREKGFQHRATGGGTRPSDTPEALRAKAEANAEQAAAKLEKETEAAAEADALLARANESGDADAVAKAKKLVTNAKRRLKRAQDKNAQASRQLKTFQDQDVRDYSGDPGIRRDIHTYENLRAHAQKLWGHVQQLQAQYRDKSATIEQRQAAQKAYSHAYGKLEKVTADLTMKGDELRARGVQFDDDAAAIFEDVPIREPEKGAGGGGTGGEPPPPRDPEGYVDPEDRKHQLQDIWGMSADALRRFIRHSPKIRGLLSPFDDIVSFTEALTSNGFKMKRNKAGRGHKANPTSVEDEVGFKQAKKILIYEELPKAYARMVRRLEGNPIGKKEKPTVLDAEKARAREFYRSKFKDGRVAPTMQEFQRRVGRAMINDDVDELYPEVTEMARLVRKEVYDPALAESLATGLLKKGGLDPKIAKSYLTRLWNIKNVKKYKEELKGLMVEDWVSKGIPRADAEAMAQEAYETILGRSSGRNAYEPILFKSTRVAHERVITVPDELLLQYDLLDTDIENQLAFFYRSVIPDIELAKLHRKMDPQSGDDGWRPDPSLEPLIEAIEARYDKTIEMAKGKTKEELLKSRQRDIDDVRSMIAEIRGILGAPADPDSMIVRAMISARRFNVLRHMGTFAMSSIPDTARAFQMYGVNRVFGDILVPFARDMQANKINGEEVKKFFGTGGDIATNSRVSSILDFGDLHGRNTVFEEGLRRGADYLALLSLLSPWNASMKQMIGAGVMNMMEADLLRMGSGAMSRAERGEVLEELARWGIGEAESRLVIRELQRRDAGGHRSADGTLLIGWEHWQNARAKQAWATAVRRQVEHAIVTPGIGDKPRWMSNETGRFFTQYKSFAMASTNRIFLMGGQKADSAYWTGVAMSTAMGMASIQLKAWAAGYDTPDVMTAQGWRWWLRNGVDRSGQWGYVPDVNNLVGMATRGNWSLGNAIPFLGGADPSFKGRNRGFVTELGGPSVSGLQDLGHVLEGASDLSAGYLPQRRAFNAGKRLTPLQNWFVTNRIHQAGFRWAEAHLRDTWELSPRGTSGPIRRSRSNSR